MRWYVASTQPNNEFLAADQLRAQGFEVFLPTVKRTVRHARRVSEVRRAYFPAYLFVALDPDRQPWRSVNGTRGVRRLVGGAERPAPVPSGLVEALKGQQDPDGLLRVAHSFAAGDRVRITDGPFAEFIGVVSGLSGADRVRVLLDLMSARAPVELPRAHCHRAA